MSHVLDASALLAYLRRETGFERVRAVLEHAAISSVNWSEVLQKCVKYALPPDDVAASLYEIGLTIEPFTATHAEQTARLWPDTCKLGLSLADRACLALALDRALPVLTADRVWTDLAAPPAIELIR